MHPGRLWNEKAADQKSHIEGVKAECRTPAVVFQGDDPKRLIACKKIIGYTGPQGEPFELK